MGIPMWREPSEADNKKTSLEKDSSASARSSIRRQPTIRRASRHSSRARGGGVLTTLQSQLLDEIHRDYGIGHRQSAVRSPVLNLGVSEDGLDLDTTRREALNRSSARANPPRRDHSSRRSRITRDEALANILASPDDSQPGRNGGPFLTPNFAPAIYHSSHPSIDGIRLPPLIRSNGRSREPTAHIPSVLLRDYRTGNGPVRPRESAIDGLGDRQRSLSPDGDRDAWETLLSTITPDVNLPSTDTSFSSNSTSTTNAPLTGASRNSANTSQTHPSSLDTSLTMASLDPYPDHLNPCDFSSDDEDTPVNYHRVLTPSGLQMPLRRSAGLHSTISGHPPIPTISFSFSDNSSESDLHQMQAILDRLARREDIPDEWWVGAGLSRNMGRGLSASAEPNENDRTR
ncbi:hypothetical protein N7533_002586 [Penicillium manginii]|uniref:uncharacterized protein n=1 Tax=Penicillium manginii TaxID=203109 RepID=UPI0025467E28|nr:uncharacterized protein N7533_002586 [Penicillium manginii]KAJ5763905.1 hypothetical protein N7533_002586 [Penicillium manginii]